MNKSIKKIDRSVIEGVKNGDMESFDIMYREYSSRLFGFVLQIIKTESDAEEIVQEVFIRIWESRKKIDNYSLFDSYMFTIAYNVTISQIRKKLSAKRYTDNIRFIQNVYLYSDSAKELDLEELLQEVSSFVEQLPPRQQEVFRLHREKGLTYREIAEKLHISKNTVENHMVRALKFLRSKMKKCLE
jgi:RNA polymerase sigma-70 factor (ECF subfamily)